MQVVFTKQTGHVLAAFTRAADPEGKVKVGELTGSGLPVRKRRTINGAASVASGLLTQIMIVPADSLDSAVVDYESAVFNSPVGFVVGGGEVAKLGADSIVLIDPTVTNNVLVSSESSTSMSTARGTSPSVTLDTIGVKVELVNDATEDKGVCIILQEKEPPPATEGEWRIAQGAISKGARSVSLDWKTSPEGAAASVPASRDYFILALIAGYQPLFGLQAL